MKVLCPACERLSDFDAFRVDAGVLFITCAKCGVEHRAVTQASSSASADVSSVSSSPAALSAPVESPAASYVPQLTPVPSPGLLHSSAEASNVVLLRTPSAEAVEKAAASAADPLAIPTGLCPKCLSKKAATSACPTCGLVFDLFDPKVLEPPAWLMNEWKQLLLAWGDEAKHERLRKRVRQGDALATLGRLYRLRLAWSPEDPWALRGRDAVVREASVTGLQRAPVEPSPASNRAKWAGVIFVVLMALAAVGAVLRMLAAAGSPE